jgi:hypothetical protein
MGGTGAPFLFSYFLGKGDATLTVRGQTLLPMDGIIMPGEFCLACLPAWSLTALLLKHPVRREQDAAVRTFPGRQKGPPAGLPAEGRTALLLSWVAGCEQGAAVGTLPGR